MSVNSRLQAIQIKSVKGKHSIGRELQSTCARKETVDIDILVTPRNDDREGSREVASEDQQLNRLSGNIINAYENIP